MMPSQVPSISGMFHWLHAFCTYANICVKQYLVEAAFLFTYVCRIFDMHKCHGGQHGKCTIKDSAGYMPCCRRCLGTQLTGTSPWMHCMVKLPRSKLPGSNSSHFEPITSTQDLPMPVLDCATHTTTMADVPSSTAGQRSPEETAPSFPSLVLPHRLATYLVGYKRVKQTNLIQGFSVDFHISSTIQ